MSGKGRRLPLPPLPAGAAPRLLTGGNPQIAKGLGPAPVQAWIAAAPGWKSGMARRIDELAGQTVPGLRRAVKYNQPLYGAPGREDWFMGLHCLTRYIKVAFFGGAGLTPLPPVSSKLPTVRYLHVTEGALDEAQLAGWIAQAAALPGQRL
ncbi:MAG: DUF1801 domain-containing protein [Paracoccaceae bacterium]